MRTTIDADSQEITAVHSEHTDIRRLLKRRERATGHPYGPIAGTLGAASLTVWGAIYYDAQTFPELAPSRGHLAFLAFAIVLGIAATATSVLWASVRSQRRLAADADRIHAYRMRQQTRLMAEQVLAGIRDQQQSERRQRWERWMASTGTDPVTDPRPEPWPGGGQVMPFERNRGNRSSG